MPLTESKKTYTLMDTWKDYLGILLKENPKWWTKYDYKLSMSNFSVWKLHNDRPVEVMNYNRYRRILEGYFTRARKAIIRGEAVNMTSFVGKICARRVERDFRKDRQLIIDWHKTKKQPLMWDEKKGKLVYARKIFFTQDHWHRIGWHKTKSITNEQVYEFKPARGKVGFQNDFKNAMDADPLLKYQYLYYPVKNMLPKSIVK